MQTHRVSVEKPGLSSWHWPRGFFHIVFLDLGGWTTRKEKRFAAKWPPRTNLNGQHEESMDHAKAPTAGPCWPSNWWIWFANRNEISVTVFRCSFVVAVAVCWPTRVPDANVAVGPPSELHHATAGFFLLKYHHQRADQVVQRAVPRFRHSAAHRTRHDGVFFGRGRRPSPGVRGKNRPTASYLSEWSFGIRNRLGIRDGAVAGKEFRRFPDELFHSRASGTSPYGTSFASRLL